MNVTEKELLKSGAADSSSLVKHRKAIIALLVIAAVLIAALAGAWDMFGTQLTAAMTIEKLDDNLWAMQNRRRRVFPLQQRGYDCIHREIPELFWGL